MSSFDLRQYIQRVALSAKTLTVKYSNELIAYWNKESLRERLHRLLTILKPCVQNAKSLSAGLGEKVLLHVKKGTPFEHFRNVCIALISCGVIAGMSEFLIGKQRGVVADGMSPRFFPEAQTIFLNTWGALEEKALRGFPRTRRGDAERRDFYQEYEKMRTGSELIVGWRCYITHSQEVGNNGFECSFANRKSHCRRPGSPCSYRMTYAPDESHRPLGPVCVNLNPPLRRHFDGGYRPVDVGLGTNTVYVGDLMEFDGKVYFAQFGGGCRLRVDISRIVVIAKETFTEEEYDDLK